MPRTATRIQVTTDAVGVDCERTRDALAHLIAIADGEQMHDFAAVSDVLAARSRRCPEPR
jgi:hypothetical protein